jgi:hypothetical protein
MAWRSANFVGARCAFKGLQPRILRSLVGVHSLRFSSAASMSTDKLYGTVCGCCRSFCNTQLYLDALLCRPGSERTSQVGFIWQKEKIQPSLL